MRRHLLALPSNLLGRSAKLCLGAEHAIAYTSTMSSMATKFGIIGLVGFFCSQHFLASSTPRNTPDLAVKKAIPLLQRTAQSWFKGAKCLSCHHQSLTQATVAVARERGFAVDESKSKELNVRIISRLVPGRYEHYEGTGDINGSAGNSYNLFGWGVAGLRGDESSSAEIYYLLSKQSSDGSWPSLSHRPPLEDDPFTLTALALRGLTVYAPPELRTEAIVAIGKAKSWLVKNSPKTNQEMTFKLLGLAWSQAPRTEIDKVRQQILSSQQPDGGWSQLASMKSDAYATGQVLVALQSAGRLSPKLKAVQLGVKFLVDSQLADGSWLVKTRRRFPGLPYFETGFPHREHQFISFAGTAWSTMALAMRRNTKERNSILDLTRISLQKVNLPLGKTPKDDRLLRAALLGTVDEVKQAITAGADINAIGIEGSTALMYAARDAKKVGYLIEHGAKVNAVSNSKTTALHVASGFVGGTESVRLLVKAGANIEALNDQGETPLALAVVSTDTAKAKFLLDNGANPNTERLIAGISALSAKNASTLKLLIDRGLKIESRVSPEGHSLLAFCVMDGSEDIVNLLLENGANPNDATPNGMTVLMTAAMCDPGHSRIVESLMRHGAKVDTKTPEGKTALSLAKKYHNDHLAEVIARQ